MPCNVLVADIAVKHRRTNAPAQLVEAVFQADNQHSASLKNMLVSKRLSACEGEGLHDP
jgi:hypothetical protein